MCMVGVMKLSVSVPDDLWTEVHTDSSGPSETVQKGLRALLEVQRAEAIPMANAPDAPTRESSRDRFESAVDKATRTITEVRSTGYRFGLLIADGMTIEDFEALDGDTRALQEQLRRAVIDPETYGTDFTISWAFMGHIGAVLSPLWENDVDDLDEDGQARRVELDSVFGDDDQPAPGVDWVSADQYDAALIGGIVPVISDLYADGVIAALADVRDEAMRRMRRISPKEQS